MPYYFFEEDIEGMEPADVVEKDSLDELQTRIEELTEQRDTAIDRAVSAENGLAEAKEKYANTFLASRSKILENHQEKTPAMTIDGLFKGE